jgi:AraC-like DNA-binding protein
MVENGSEQQSGSSILVPLVLSRHLQTLIRSVDRLGIPIEPLLREAAVHPATCEKPDLVMPEQRLWTILDRLRTSQGPVLPALAGFGPSNRVYELGLFDQRHYVTLASLLLRFCAAMSEQTNSSKFRLQVEDGIAVLDRRQPSLREGAWPVEQYMVSALTDLAQMAAGDAWWPDELWLLYEGPLHPEEEEWLAPARVHLDSPRTAISIPLDLLSLPCRIPDRFAESLRSPDGMYDLQRNLRDTLAFLVKSGQPTLDRLARDAGVHERTLQRRLRTLGISFQQLIDEVRLEFAASRLGSSDELITDIALDLGYQDHSTFSRAFRRWAGISPSLYRQGHATAGNI